LTYLYKNTKLSNNKGIHMEITNTIFETLLTKNNFKKKEFAEYSKIPYDTVAGWKKERFCSSLCYGYIKRYDL